MSNSSEPVGLKCSECAHENEPQRVFCHNCGNKLDRSLLPKPNVDIINPAGLSDGTKRRVAKLMNPNRLWYLRELKRAAKVILAALLAAGFYLIVRTPANLPADKDIIPEQDAWQIWNDKMSSPVASGFVLREDAINAHLKREIRRLKANKKDGILSPSQMYVKLYPGIIEVNAVRELLGWPFYTSVRYRLEMDAEKLEKEVTSTYFGRLGVDPNVGIIGNLALADVWNIFEKEKERLNRLARVDIHKGAIVFYTKPGR